MSISSRSRAAKSCVLVTALLLLGFSAVGCGSSEPHRVTVDRVGPFLSTSTSTTQRTSTTTSTTTSINYTALGKALDRQQVERTVVLQTVAGQQTFEREHPARSAAPRSVSIVSGGGGTAPCGGDLPPCWRVGVGGTESNGDWNAHNYHGCVEHHVVEECWGPYQFSGSWAGKLGLPLDLWTTTHEQWVAAARDLWAGGAGCSNWSACG